MRQSVAERVRARLVAEVDPHEAVHADLVAGLVREEAPLLDTSRAAAAVAEVMADVVGLGSLEPLLAMHERDRANGLMDAPWPPVYPKQPDEPPRVSRSRAKKT